MIQRLGLVAAALLVPALLFACGGASAPSPSEQGIIVPLTTPTPQPPTPSPVPESPTPTPTLTPEPTPSRVSLGHLAGDAQVPDLPSPFVAAVSDPELESLIIETLGQDLSSYSVVVHHLADGRSAAINDDRVYRSASLFKLGLLLEAHRQRDAGEIDFAQELVLEKKYLQYDFGTLELLGLQEGDIITVADAIRAMIVVSDTPTAVMIQDLVGPARVTSTYQSLGLQDTVYVSGLPTSARDMAVLLEAIARGDGVSPQSRLQMLSLLLQESIRDRIPSGVPAGTPVAHKTGNLVDATHDVGLVWSPNGPYVLAVLSDQPWRSKPIVAVSRAVYDYFAQNP